MEDKDSAFDAFNEEIDKALAERIPKPKEPDRRPRPMLCHIHGLNPTWIAEYKAQHGLTTEEAIEAAKIMLDRQLRAVTKALAELNYKDGDAYKGVVRFIEDYKVIEGQYGPIKLVTTPRVEPQDE
jgi:hypothetical protein